MWKSNRSKCLSGAVVLTGFFVSVAAQAEPNTHGPAVSTWDTRTSSNAFTGYGNLLGRLHGGSFHSNFSTASGESSVQFGFHYLNARVAADFPIQQGVGASGVYLTTFPSATGHANGVAKTAFALYAGGAPTALLRGFRNNLTFPVVLGIGVPISPVAMFTFTPWVEGSPSFNLDTTYEAYTFDNRGVGDIVQPDPVTGEGTIDGSRAQEFAEHSIGYEFAFQFGLRGGVATTLRVDDNVDFNVNATLGSLGTALSGDAFLQIGGGLVVHWGDAPRSRVAPEPAKPSAPVYPGQPYAPGQPYPPTQYYPPTQPYPPAQTALGTQPPGQPYPQQPYPAQPYPPAQPAPGTQPPGQPYPQQPYPAQPYPAQPYPPAQPQQPGAASQPHAPAQQPAVPNQPSAGSAPAPYPGAAAPPAAYPPAQPVPPPSAPPPGT